MIVDLNRDFLNYDGTPFLEEHKTSDGKCMFRKVQMKTLVCVRLFNAGDKFSEEEKYDAYLLMHKIRKAGDNPVELSTSEANLILRCCSSDLIAGAYGQLKSLLTPSE